MPTAEELHALLVASELTFADESTVAPGDAGMLLRQTVTSQEWRAEDGSLIGIAAAYAHGEGGLEVDRSHPELWPLATAWLVEQDVHSVQCLEGDLAQLEALADAGFAPSYGAFDLERASADVDAEPAFGDWTATTPEAVHACIYSVWTDVEGHVARPFDEWTRLFLEDLDPALPVVVVEDGVVQAVALARIEDDGLGWVPQLAVRHSAQGSGLGRRVLLEAVRRLQAAGAHGVGLSVNAPNAKALGLYESLGFEKVSAWITSKR